MEENAEIQSLKQRIAELEKEVDTAYGEFETFAHAAAHDLRSPLRAISGYCFVLLEDFAEPLGSEGAGYLNRIKDGTKRMNDLVDRLLKVAHVGRHVIQRSTVDLSALASTVGEELKTTYPNTELQVEAGLHVEADASLMKMVLENLLDNAFKFSGKVENPKVEVEKSGEAILVRDNGIGFEQEHSKMLFRPFQRLHAQTDYPGSGLGLAITQRILAKHGSAIWAEGEAGKGAVFFFRVP